MPENIVRKAQGGSIIAPNEPCPRCGVRADVGCKHRPAEGSPPPAIARAEYEKRDGRRNYTGQGHNFHRAKLSSLWGKAGNPTAGEVARCAEAVRRTLGGGSGDD